MRSWVAVLAMVALTGCTAAEPSPSPPPTASSVPTAADLDARVKAALAPPDVFDSLGFRFHVDFPELDQPAMDNATMFSACGSTQLRVDSGESAARMRQWTGEIHLVATVYAMSELPASVLMTTIQRRARLCTTYVPHGVDTWTVTPDVPLATPSGVEGSYSYCEEHRPIRSQPFTCRAVLVRGNLLVAVSMTGQDAGEVRGRLATVVPIFAETFVKA